MRKILLDTSAYSNFFKDYPKLQEVVEEAERIYFSPVVFGELIKAFRAGKKEQENRGDLEEFLSDPHILVVDITQETADIYGQISSGLYKKGKPIPTNDIWIAAQAIETGSVLVTYDDHFKSIPGLRIWGE